MSAPAVAAADPAVFRELLQRLLLPLQPAAAGALRERPSDATPATLLEFVRGQAPLRVEQLGSVAELAARAERGLCLLEDGGCVLVDILGDGECSIRLGAALPPRRVTVDVLEPLFPCTVAYLRSVPADRGDDPPVAGLGAAATAVYLRVTSQLLGLSTPIALMIIIDKVVSSGAENTLVVLVVGVALLTTFQYLFLAAGTLHSTREVEAHVLVGRAATFAALVGFPGAAGAASTGWDVMQNCSESARYRVETRTQFHADCLYVCLLAMLMYAFSPMLLAVSAAFVPVYLGIGAVSARMTRHYAANLTPQRSELSRQYFEAVAAADVVRGLNLSTHLSARWQALDGRAAGGRWRLAAVNRLAAQAVEFAQKLSLLGVMLLGVASVIAGAMTLGQYIAFNLLCMQLAPPVLRLAAFRRDTAEQRLRDQSRQMLHDGARQHCWPATGTLAFPEHGPVIVRVAGLPVGGEGPAAPTVSFTLRSGVWLGIVGPSGCGKSTLLASLTGLRAATRGEVQVNGMPLSRFEAASLARQVRLVSQQPVIYSASIADNIRLGDLAAAPQLIVTVAAVCGLGELLARLPRHLDTLVGAGGQALSGGELQRIAIARALLSRPRMLLLDEATSALDAASERLLLGNLRRFLADAAVVVVSHRPSSLSGCEHCVDLGRLAAANAGAAAESAATGRR